MDKNIIDNLREALQFSPNNIPLKLHLASSLLKFNMLDEAEQEYQEVLQLKDTDKAKIGLAHVFFAKGQYPKCNVVLEGLIDTDNKSLEVLLLHTKALVKEEAVGQAIEVYKLLLRLYPDFSDKELDERLRMVANFSEQQYDGEQEENFLQQNEDDKSFLQRPHIGFSEVGGMDNVKKEIDLKIIQPLKHPEIYKAYGKKIGGGILLYGPPGCGKTFLAKATAGEVNAKFISVGLNDILDMWIGSSEKNLHGIFEVARRNTPCVLFFDEIDALGANRTDMKKSAGRHLINQFLQELDGVENNNDGVLVLGATNAPWHLDAAFRRPGRFDRIIFVPPPDETAREAIFKLKLKDKPTERIDYRNLAKKTKAYSGADIEAVIDVAIEGKLEQAIKEGIPKPLNTKDLQKALKQQKPSTKEWFTTAKNFALYANESGLYNEILEYLNIKL